MGREEDKEGKGKRGRREGGDKHRSSTEEKPEKGSEVRIVVDIGITKVNGMTNRIYKSI